MTRNASSRGITAEDELAQDEESDRQAIREIVGRQFSSMSWRDGSGPDINAFRGDFLPAATLFPAARPVSPRSLDDFCARMAGLAGSTLVSFDERVMATHIVLFGNVAMAAVICENTENGSEINRNVEMMLLVKEAGAWRIAAQAWDKETPSQPIGDIFPADA